MEKTKVPCRVGGWEVMTIPGTPYTFGDGSRYWGPWPVAKVPPGEELFFAGLEYATSISEFEEKDK